MTERVVSLAERLKDRRAERGISQAQAARELDVARTAYRLWEMEAAKPSPDRWRLIARWLGVSVTTMLLAEDMITEKEALSNDKAEEDFSLTGATWDERAERATGDYFAQGRSLLSEALAAGHLTEEHANELQLALSRLEGASPIDTTMPWEPATRTRLNK